VKRLEYFRGGSGTRIKKKLNFLPGKHPSKGAIPGEGNDEKYANPPKRFQTGWKISPGLSVKKGFGIFIFPALLITLLLPGYYSILTR
jgi:hypothetical protein